MSLLGKNYWRYWLQVCTIRLSHVCSFSDSVSFLQAVFVFDSMHAFVGIAADPCHKTR